MQQQQPMIPDPDAPTQTPGAPVTEPEPAEPAEFADRYDEAEAESFPASDPPSASQPGV